MDLLVRRPTARCTARQNQTILCNRKTDLIGNHGTAKFALDFDGEHIGQNCRSQTSGIGVDQEK